MIAMIIGTIVAPTLANFIQFRANHPKEAPEANQPKNLIQRIGARLMRFFQSLWWGVGGPLVFIAYNIYIISGELRKTAPITRGDIVLISESVAAVLFFLSNMTVNIMQRSIGSLGESILKQCATIETLSNTIKTVDETVDLKIKILALPKPSEADSDKPPLGRLRKMLNAINDVFRKSN
jgi:hypothetical protein